uniref:Putative capsid protein n=1 Tax=viral metagenome TaxID=1070528 RepID=A0A6H1ZE48_9ZZZZ
MEPEVTTTEEVAEVPEVVNEQVVEAENKETPPAEAAIVEEPKKPSAQERINEITRKRREAEREAEYWKNKALQSEPVKPKPVIPEGRPKQDQFETTESYEDALLTWHEKRREAEISLVEQNRRKEESVKQFNNKADAMRVEHEDYDEVISAPIFTDSMKDVLLTSDNGPELAYYLGTNRDIANKIAKLPASLQPYELGKLETQFLLSKKTKKITAAPEPIVPGGATGGASKIDESKLSDDEWYKLEQQRLKEKLKKRTGG